MQTKQLKEKFLNTYGVVSPREVSTDSKLEDFIDEIADFWLSVLDSSLSEIEEEIIKQPIRISDFNDPNCNDAFNQGGEEFKDTALQIIRERKGGV